MKQKLQNIPNLALLLLLAMIITFQHQHQQHHYSALAQPITTNQNGQQVHIDNQSAVVDDNNLRNSSSLSISARLVGNAYPLILPVQFQRVWITGSLTTGNFSSTGISPSVPQISPLRDAQILIIIANITDGKIINTTSVRTNSSGVFSTDVSNREILDVYPSHIPPDITRIDDEIVFIAYFGGNENNFPTHALSGGR